MRPPPRRRTTFNSAKTSLVTDEAKKKLLVHEKVEVRSMHEGLLGSWHVGQVIGSSDKVRQIMYDERVDDKGSGLVEDVRVSPILDGLASEHPLYIRGKIRPLPPPSHLIKESICYGLCVDVRFENAGWWEGVIFDNDKDSDERRIFFPDMGDERIANIEDLRVTRDWDEASGKWKIRGTWQFLESVEKVASCWPLAVSARQLLFEVQVKLGWVDWTRPCQDFWQSALRSVLTSSYDLLMKQIVEELGFSPEDISMHMMDEVKPVAFPSVLAQGNVVEPVTVEQIVPKPLKASNGEDEDLVEVEKKYCPRAVEEYARESGSSKAGRKAGVRGGEEPLTSKAKKHLSAVGWTFYYVVKKRRNDKENREMRYVSPDGKTFNSLITACNWYIQLGQPKQAALNKAKASSSLRCKLPWLSTFPWESPLNVPETVDGIEKRGILEASCSKKAKSDDSFAAPQARSTLAKLIDANVVVAGAKVQYRSKAGVKMQEGRISREGIVCCCCDRVLKLSDFEVHAGSTNRRPSAHIFLEDGRSLTECKTQLKDQ